MSANIVITQGEFAASDRRDQTISTLLGSCVACCLWDPKAQVGGMNHILLASRGDGSDEGANLAGINAMELLVNDLLKYGARRSRLVAKAFGGARMISGLSRIGPANAAFVLDYLRREHIECVSQSLGGTKARHVVFSPSTGAVRLRMHDSVPQERPTPRPEAIGNGLELF